MDRQLKERLVGALVLVVLAIILIPTVLDGPDETSQTQALDLPPVEGAATDTPVQSYEFDLDGNVNDAAEPEITTPQQQQQAIIDASPVVDQTDPATVEEEKPAVAETSTPVETEPVSVQPEPKTPAPIVAKGEWAIQVGSFSKQQLAQDLADQLKSQGYRVFLMEFTTGGITYHRVRIGPFTDEAKANQTAKEVHQKTGGPAKVVSN